MTQPALEILQIQTGDVPPSLFAVKPGFDQHACTARLAWLPSVNAEWWTARREFVLVGWMVLTWSGKLTHSEYPDVSDLFVQQNYRGQGIGTALLNFAERLATVQGYPKIGLAVNPTLNPRALRLYEHLGYHHDGRPLYLDGVYDGNEDWVIDLEKSLHQYIKC